MNNFGLSERTMNYIAQAASDIPELSRLVLFGSRAMGNYKQGSDIDLACFGKETNMDTQHKLGQKLNEELPIPYFVDVVIYNSLNNSELKRHITDQGIDVYTKSVE